MQYYLQFNPTDVLPAGITNQLFPTVAAMNTWLSANAGKIQNAKLVVNTLSFVNQTALQSYNAAKIAMQNTTQQLNQLQMKMNNLMTQPNVAAGTLTTLQTSIDTATTAVATARASVTATQALINTTATVTQEADSFTLPS